MTTLPPLSSVSGLDLRIPQLLAAYRSGELTPAALMAQLDQVMSAGDPHRIWIQRLPLAELLAYANRLKGKSPDDLPLYGIPFAVKDNIDLAGISTTAACAEFAYIPSESATVVRQLIEAGAIPLGKTNLDQFATGLVGVRSPYGACRNSFNPDYISGGSSSGSAVSVALGLASFSLGTDTAGSGRVPAAFNNLVGHKPTCGLLSTHGVVPACRTLDCVSIFALTAADVATVLQVAQGYDEADPYSRPAPAGGGGFSLQEEGDAREIKAAQAGQILSSHFTFGIPHADQLAFFGNTETPQLFADAVERLKSLGGKAVEIDFSVFLETARLLYEGPWVAERYAAIRDFIESQPEALYPVTGKIIGGATRFSAADAYTYGYKLKALQRQAAKVWQDVDFIVTPTAGTHYTIAEVDADPVATNSNLGYYTNFMNLLDLSAIAVPAGFQSSGLPFGITLCAPAFADHALLALATRWEADSGRRLGAGACTLEMNIVKTEPLEISL